ncbi:radical SAM protein [Anaerocolumna xylanovorans]|uniref:4Fe-4S single cluster domain-containing protein n=1 Tax=Anaerocolumna xylanovorans DSM 12503 TaxID=1121345 RepID=A0A1M7XWK2_9FIRM|nr:radical SAM protein [Anaerocolumna xylanovorans]SHO43113.1 4Fe-4S single cluster domain-containing protein [Anaerocolumna xylanovorans DSM 12503]
MERKKEKAGNISYLTLKLTNRCNLNCAMCGQVFSPERFSKDELELDIINRILEETPFVKQVYLFGGEPLLYKELSELLELLQKKNIMSRITTNGTLLVKYAEDIVKYGVTNVEVSLDSHNKDVLSSIRGFDIYDLIIKGIEHLVDEKRKYNSQYPKININCVVLPHNYKELVEFVDHVRSHIQGVDSIYFQYPMITTQEQGISQNKVTQKLFGMDSISWKWFNNPAQQFADEEIRYIYNELELLKHDPLANFKNVSNYEELERLLSPRYVKEEKVCECPFTALTIFPNGDATFCTDFPDIVLGNVYRESLNNIWKGSNSQRFREYLNVEGGFPICARCYHVDEKLMES